MVHVVHFILKINSFFYWYFLTIKIFTFVLIFADKRGDQDPAANQQGGSHSQGQKVLHR